MKDENVNKHCAVTDDQKIQTRQIQSGNYKKIKNTETKGERWKCDNSTDVRCYDLEAIMKKWK